MKKLRIALLASCAIFGVALVVNHRTPIIREASAQMTEFGGDRMIPLGFCAYTVGASSNITNGTGCFGTGVLQGTAVGLPVLAKYAQVCVSGTAYYRDDGIAAVAGVTGTGGMPMSTTNSAPSCIYYAGNLSAFSMAANGTVTVSVLLYGQP